ncbi:hypothetical protein ACFOTA_11900 [Chitinophaga sp. GCM10012297]|uniref:Uncharacterized protein n=1 Tax=Chitinophaga chungangae TaxID=2821488 RepID=A0ABS3YE25_9BACT|nr:hypothetical protein [Chitinophaga chungangae]MBO9152913.1 hypothetical protein [Chitinophaga chungangae]
MLVAIGAASSADAVIDIHLHDTYVVISYFNIAIIYAVLLITEAGLYTATSWFRQWRWLQIFHIIGLLLPPLFFIFSGSMHYNPSPGMPQTYFEYNRSFLNDPLTRMVIVIFLIFLAGHIGFIINIITGFFRGRKS